MNVTFCGHSKIYQTCEISKWLDIILPWSAADMQRYGVAVLRLRPDCEADRKD